VNWDALGAIAEAAGAIGVVASLAYLALQIRNNTQGLRSSAVQSITDRTVDVSLTLATDPTISEILDRGYTALDSLSEDERRRFRQVITAQMQNYEAVYYHYRAGFLEEGQWLPMRRRLEYAFGRPGVHELWKTGLSRAHGDDFVAVCEEILRSREGAA
jgi:hypothetical protein